MRSIRDILEKLSIDDVNTSNDIFPIDKDLAEIESFLIRNGFNKCEHSGKYSGNYGDSIKIFNAKKGRYYIIYTSSSTIEFADTSKSVISKKNPLYAVTIEYEKFKRVIASTNWKILTKDEFLEEMKKYFNLR